MSWAEAEALAGRPSGYEQTTPSLRGNGPDRAEAHAGWSQTSYAMHQQRTPNGSRRGRVVGEQCRTVAAQTEQKLILAGHRRAMKCTGVAHQVQTVEGES